MNLGGEIKELAKRIQENFEYIDIQIFDMDEHGKNIRICWDTTSQQFEQIYLILNRNKIISR